MTARHPRGCECTGCCDLDALRENPLYERERAEWLKAVDFRRRNDIQTGDNV